MRRTRGTCLAGCLAVAAGIALLLAMVCLGVGWWKAGGRAPTSDLPRAAVPGRTEDARWSGPKPGPSHRAQPVTPVDPAPEEPAAPADERTPEEETDEEAVAPRDPPPGPPAAPSPEPSGEPPADPVSPRRGDGRGGSPVSPPGGYALAGSGGGGSADSRILWDWIRQARVEPPARHRNLFVYPVVLPAREGPPVALAGGWQASEVTHGLEGTLVDTAAPGADRNFVVLENRTEWPVLVLGGQLLRGGRQDRALPHDLFLPPRSGPLYVEVFCAEHGRWTYRPETLALQDRDAFRDDAGLPPLSVRASASQGAVWKAIEAARLSARLQLPPHSSLVAVGAKIPRVEGALEALGDLPERYPQMNGAMVQVGPDLLVLEGFSSRSAFLSLWPVLLRSYAAEAALRPRISAATDPRRVAHFLELSGEETWQPLEYGQATVLWSPEAGHATLVEGEVLHAALFTAAASDLSRLSGAPGEERLAELVRTAPVPVVAEWPQARRVWRVPATPSRGGAAHGLRIEAEPRECPR